MLIQSIDIEPIGHASDQSKLPANALGKRDIRPSIRSAVLPSICLPDRPSVSPSVHLSVRIVSSVYIIRYVAFTRIPSYSRYSVFLPVKRPLSSFGVGESLINRSIAKANLAPFLSLVKPRPRQIDYAESLQ